MRVRTFFGPLVAGALALGLAGCYGDGEITLHEAGEYKGPVDPLVDRLANNEQLRDELQARVDQQADR